LHHAADLDGAGEEDAVAGGGQVGICQRQFGTGQRRFGSFLLGIGLGNLFRAVAGFELGELFACRAYLRLGLIPLGAGAVELATGDGAGRRQRTLATPLLLCLEGGRLGGGQLGPGTVCLFAAIAARLARALSRWWARGTGSRRASG
jgi:hypothetical protein